MSNREQYKRAFQALHASRDFSMEAMDMNTKKMRFNFSRGLAVAMIITVLLVGSLSAAYATDLGGFRRTIQIWMYGEAKDAIVEPYTGGGEDVDVECDGEATMAEPSYVVTWTDGNGEKHQMQGGGVAMEADGTERPLTMDEYLEHLGAIQVAAGKQAEAAETYRKLLKLSPKHPAALEFLKGKK